MGIILAIAAGGALGAVTRYLTILAAIAILPGSFPWGIMIANVLGSFLIGIAIAAFNMIGDIHEALKAFVTIGFLGAFTTFSAYSMNIIELWERQDYGALIFYALGSVFLSILAVIGGMIVTKMVLV